MPWRRPVTALCLPPGTHTPLCTSHAHQPVIDLTMMSPRQMALPAAAPASAALMPATPPESSPRLPTPAAAALPVASGSGDAAAATAPEAYSPACDWRSRQSGRRVYISGGQFFTHENSVVNARRSCRVTAGTRSGVC